MGGPARRTAMAEPLPFTRCSVHVRVRHIDSLLGNAPLLGHFGTFDVDGVHGPESGAALFHHTVLAPCIEDEFLQVGVGRTEGEFAAGKRAWRIWCNLHAVQRRLLLLCAGPFCSHHGVWRASERQDLHAAGECTHGIRREQTCTRTAVQQDPQSMAPSPPQQHAAPAQSATPALTLAIK